MPTWELGLHAVVEAALAHDGIVGDAATGNRIAAAVIASIDAMPAAQRRVLTTLLAGQPARRAHRPRGTWLLTTRLPGASDVGAALHSLILFHAWSEIDDPEEPDAPA